jgi:acyl phosphate:glycerol-3-phosphate acyltransferase
MGITIIIKILIVLSAYLIGSIPTAYVIFKLKRGDDIRKYGSGNVGGTNVIRTLGTPLGVATIIADIVKGFIPVLISFIFYIFYPSNHNILVAVVSVATVLGHIFPVYIRFRGGKAISTSFGVIIGITVLPFISNPVWLRIIPIFVILGVWGIVFSISKIVSLGSLIAGIATPISFYFTGYTMAIVAASFCWALLTFISHRKNIQRLIRGEERKIKGKGHKWRSK